MAITGNSDKLPNLIRASQNGYLWPSIAEAVKSFLQRRDDADDYEKLWRLIYIWESISITLCNVSVAKLIKIQDECDLLLIKEHLYGQQWDLAESCMRPRGLGVFKGSNESRIQILNIIRKMQDNKSSILQGITTLLNATEAVINGKPHPLAKAFDEFERAWHLVDKKTRLDKESMTVFECLKAMNSFRNRFAHVPFPYDSLKDLRHSFEQLTELLFSVAPVSSTSVDRKSGLSSALTGCILQRNHQWRGCEHRQNENQETYEKLNFGFPSRNPREVWPAFPFSRIDNAQRHWILTKASVDTDEFEYTRFLAEQGAVRKEDIENGLELIPKPHPGDYLAAEQSEKVGFTKSKLEERSVVFAAKASKSRSKAPYADAIEALRKKQFDRAVSLLRQHLEQSPDYHVGWLKLGIALRQWAVQLADDSGNVKEAIGMLEESYTACGKARGHFEVKYQANAWYQGSKTQFRLYRMKSEVGFAEQARSDADQANALLPDDEEIANWLAYLRRKLPRFGEDQV